MIELVALGLMGWRIASLFVLERGPWHIFEWLRMRAGVPDVGEPEGFLPELLSCMWCASVWGVALAWIGWQLSEEAVLVGAGMTAAVIVQRIVQGVE